MIDKIRNRWRAFSHGIKSMDLVWPGFSWQWRLGPWIQWTPPTPENPVWFHFTEMGVSIGPLILLHWIDED